MKIKKMMWKAGQTLSLVMLLLLGSLQLASAALGDLERVSVSSSGVQGNHDSWNANLSGNGRYVAFNSKASNLVGGDTNGERDVFVHDQDAGTTTRVSVDSSGIQGNDRSFDPSMSHDGRYVAFSSDASNLVSDDTNGERDVFVHDQQTGETIRVSVNSNGEEGNDYSNDVTISSDGRFIAFHSDASNLVVGDTNGREDIFVYDQETQETVRLSIDSSGAEANNDSFDANISGNGRFVAFKSLATNLVSGDTNGKWDVFVHDRETGETTLVSVSSDGGQGNATSFRPHMSYDGRFVAFESYASNLVDGDTGRRDAFVHDRLTKTTIRISTDRSGGQPNHDSFSPRISSDGRFVAFSSRASNLVDGDTNGQEEVFVYDRYTGEMTRVAVNSSGVQGNGKSNNRSLSSDGRFVAFAAFAKNLVDGDTNNRQDIFVTEQAIVDPPASCDLSLGYNVIHGTERNDRLKGTPDNDIIIGYGGNDRIEGMGGNDCIIGGEGSDRLIGGEGNDILWGGEADNAVVYERRDRDRLYGEEGNDIMHGGGDHDHLEGGDDHDVMYGDDGNDGLHGGDGNDEMHGGSGKDRMEGRDGDDIMYGDAGDDTLVGRDGNDYLNGGDDRDRLEGGNGDDEMHGGDGDDRMNGDKGNDQMWGDAGKDSMQGRDGNDVMYGGTEDDDMKGGRDDDEMHGGDHNDRMDGDRGDDRMFGDDGDDSLDARDGEDHLEGGNGDDNLKGGKHDDFLDGGADNDRLDGGNRDQDTCNNGESLRSCELVDVP